MINLAIWAVLLVAMNWIWPHQTLWHLLVYIWAFLFCAIIIRFFRVPIQRKTTVMEDAVLCPADGEVVVNEFIVAFNPKSSDDNEHNTIVLKDKKGREVLVRQIAGFVARRIVCDLLPGDEAVAGEELGMIRFGSRVDVFLPVDAEVKVKIGDKVRGKETVLAVLL